MQKKNILNAGMMYLPTQAIILVMSLVKGLILPKLLIPDDYGFLSIIFLVIAYSKVANLGVLNAFDREYPKMLGNDNYCQDKESYRDTCFSLFLINNFIYSTGVIVYSYWKYYDDLSYFIIFLLISIGILFDNINEFVVDIYRGHRNFFMVSINRISVNIFGVLSIVILTYFWGITGSVISLFITNIFTLYFFINIKDKPRFSLNLSLLKSIYKLSFQLFVVLMLSILISSIDRIYVAKFYTSKDIGLYSIAQSMSGVILMAFTSATYVIYPYLLSYYAQNSNLLNFQKYYKKLGLIYTCFTPLLLSVVYFFLTVFIPWYLPAYQKSLQFLPLLLVGSCWLVLLQLSNTFLLVIDKQSKIVRNQACILFVAVLCFGYIIVESLSVYFVALSFAGYSFCYAMLSFFSIAACLEINLKSTLYMFVRFNFPFVFFLSLSLIISVTNNMPFELFNNNIRTFIFNIIVLIICGIPFVWNINKKTAFVSESWQIVKVKIMAR